MARPTIIREEQILEAARELFLEKGIRATTAEVARRAGVAEGSIFNRFKTKQELFLAAMRTVEPPWIKSLLGRVGRGDIREHLIEVGREAIEFFRAHLPLLMMAWSNPSQEGLPAHLAGPNPPPLRVLKQLTGFFEAEMRAGRLSRHDPEILARMYLGSLKSYVLLELLLKAQDELPLPVETYLRGAVNLLWRGVAPEDRS